MGILSDSEANLPTGEAGAMAECLVAADRGFADRDFAIVRCSGAGAGAATMNRTRSIGVNPADTRGSRTGTALRGVITATTNPACAAMLSIVVRQ